MNKQLFQFTSGQIYSKLLNSFALSHLFCTAKIPWYQLHTAPLRAYITIKLNTGITECIHISEVFHNSPDQFLPRHNCIWRAWERRWGPAKPSEDLREQVRGRVAGSSAGLGQKSRFTIHHCSFVCLSNKLYHGPWGRMRGWIEGRRRQEEGCVSWDMWVFLRERPESIGVRDGRWHSKSNKLNHFEFDEYMLAMAQPNYAIATRIQIH